MAYEVLKMIGGRQYRYRVESYRDAETGKVRNRWTYVGKAGEERPAPKRHSVARLTRQRIIASFLALIDRLPWQAVTPGAIAAEAGLAHGTFYRHFRDRDELLELCTKEANVELDARLAQLGEIASSFPAERARLRAWVIDFMQRPTAPPGLMRVWVELPQLALLRQQRHAARIRGFTRYIEALRTREYAPAVGGSALLAIALTFEIEALARRSTYENELLSRDEYAAVAETFDRLLFWRPPATSEEPA